MDILSLIKPTDLKDFMDNYDYNTDFVGNALFPAEKTDDLEFSIANLVENGNVPAIAKVHSFDSEAVIGSREGITVKNYQKLLIKEKLPTSERAQYLLMSNAGEDKLVKHIYNDFDIENQRVLARVELMNMQLVSTGQVQIQENNVNLTVDYGYNTSTHNVSFSSWGTASHSILGDIESLQATARAKGYELTRALTSSKVLSYLTKNTEIKDVLLKVGKFPTQKNVLDYIYEQYGLQFATNDAVYKIEGGDATTHRFFPENKIAFMTSDDFGKGFYAPTPDELNAIPSAKDVDLRANVYIKAWKEQDPSTVYTMASAVYIPVPKDINSLYIATVSA